MTNIGPKDVNIDISKLDKTGSKDGSSSKTNIGRVNKLEVTSLNEDTNLLLGVETFTKKKKKSNDNNNE
jgi:hypothetical protein